MQDLELLYYLHVVILVITNNSRENGRELAYFLSFARIKTVEIT